LVFALAFAGVAFAFALVVVVDFVLDLDWAFTR
jgi:hypothetical protein